MKNGNDQHIFLVDDEPKVRQIIDETLGQLRLKVSCFACAAYCLDHLCDQECDLLITDLKMPEMDGIELLRCAKKIVPLLPVLIITGYGDVPTAVQAIKAGAEDFIEKPLDKISFVKKVRAILQDNGNHTETHTGEPLTRSERRVLKLVLDAKSNKEIADLLNRSRRTIEVHRARVMRKLGADSLVDLVKRATLGKLSDGSSSSFEQGLS